MNSIKIFCFSIIVAVFVFTDLEALKCKVNDGPSEEKLKRVARACMRKLSAADEDGSESNSDYEDSFDNRGGNYDRGKSNNNNNRGQQSSSVDRRNQQGQSLQGSEWSTGNRGNGRHQSGMDRNGQQGQQRTENRHGNSGDNNNGGVRRYEQNSGNGREVNSYNAGDARDSKTDKACVIHCFFQELNMLNNQDYPDKHKVIYVITRDIRDNELREFYADSIQECFRFLEMEQRRDKCQFSKDLINCMAEYARANCEDWYNQTMIFNS